MFANIKIEQLFDLSNGEDNEKAGEKNFSLPFAVGNRVVMVHRLCAIISARDGRIRRGGYDPPEMRTVRVPAGGWYPPLR